MCWEETWVSIWVVLSGHAKGIESNVGAAPTATHSEDSKPHSGLQTVTGRSEPDLLRSTLVHTTQYNPLLYLLRPTILYAYHKYILGCHADAAKARPCTLTSNTFRQRRNIAIPLPFASPFAWKATSVAVPSPFASSINPLPGKTIKCVESVVRTHHRDP